MDLNSHEVSLLRQLAAEDGQLVGAIGETLTAVGLVRLTPGKNALQRAWLTEAGRTWLVEHEAGLEVLDALAQRAACHDARCFAHEGEGCRRGFTHPSDCPMMAGG